ncbi:MAG: hypothetical protein ACRELB_21855 [Polyangiaceae bacterium]
MNDFTDPQNWETFDTSTVDARATSFGGAAFDGRYLYLVPFEQTLAVRFDTQQASLGSSGAWSTFDLSNVSAGATVFQGAVYDGRYVYLVPSTGLAVRYDTHAGFTTAASWETYAIGVDFIGGSFDGSHVYFSPYGGSAAQFNTSDSFSAPASWSTFDTSAIGGAAENYGATFDGRYLYLAPASAGAVARYDTQIPFAQGSSWSTFDTTTLDASTSGFIGSGFDGQYVYFVPHGTTVASRYDTTFAFTSTAAWSTFGVTAIPSVGQSLALIEYAGMVFDGRYVYFVPNFGAPAVRYDTTAPFGTPGSWQAHPLVSPDAAANEPLHFGGAFDGRYVYYVPSGSGTNSNSLLVRFDARIPSGPMPASYHGSFM